MFNDPSLGGPGYVSNWVTGEIVKAADYSIAGQVWIQAKAVGVTVIWSGVVAYLSYKVVDMVVGLRVSEEEEREGGMGYQVQTQACPTPLVPSRFGHVVSKPGKNGRRTKGPNDQIEEHLVVPVQPQMVDDAIPLRESRHRRQERGRLIESFRPEKDPPDDDDKERVQAPDGSGRHAKDSPELSSLQDGKYTMVRPPDHEGPPRAVP